MNERRYYVVYCQDYRLAGDRANVMQEAVGPVRRCAPFFNTRKEAREFMQRKIADARDEGYQTEYWVGRYRDMAG